MTDHLSRRGLVDALASLAIDQVVAGEEAVLRSPPGRSPAVELQAKSAWFNSLDQAGQDIVVAIMRATAYGSLHRVLTAIDGAAAIRTADVTGELRVMWKSADGSVVDLTESTQEPDLHDLLAEWMG